MSRENRPRDDPSLHVAANVSKRMPPIKPLPSCVFRAANLRRRIIAEEFPESLAESQGQDVFEIRPWL